MKDTGESSGCIRAAAERARRANAVISCWIASTAASRAQVFAQTAEDDAGSALDVRTLPDRSTAVDQVEGRRITAAYVLSDTRPELIVATAASDTGATVAQKVFTPVAARQGAPLAVTDVVPAAAGIAEHRRRPSATDASAPVAPAAPHGPTREEDEDAEELEEAVAV
ncbi:hypothetical protein ACIP46_34790 [Streptomyces lavendulae]|uniref:hypothetical protein n=1 Tax=Streptomyces lavendulae TaxID=1914 RepID=UPI003807660E